MSSAADARSAAVRWSERLADEPRALPLRGDFLDADPSPVARKVLRSFGIATTLVFARPLADEAFLDHVEMMRVPNDALLAALEGPSTRETWRLSLGGKLGLGPSRHRTARTRRSQTG